MEQQPLPDIFTTLADHPRDALISVQGLAQLFHRSDEMVRRAIDTGELPHPVQLFSKRYWTVGVLIAHVLQRLADEARTQEKVKAKIREIGQRP